MNQESKHNKDKNNKFWESPILVITLPVLVLGLFILVFEIILSISGFCIPNIGFSIHKIEKAFPFIGFVFGLGLYYQKNKSNLEAIKIQTEFENRIVEKNIIIAEKDRIINDLNNRNTLDTCKYENEIALLKQSNSIRKTSRTPITTKHKKEAY